MSESGTGHVRAVDTDGVEIKGLKEGSVGLGGAVVMGLSSTAPMYSLTATIGLVAAAVGVYAPACMIVAFIPMLFTAYAYRELNNVTPDCGTTFTWATKAFGPHVGWMGGWGIAISGIIFLGNAAQVTGTTFFEALHNEELADNKYAVAAVGIIFIVIMAYISYRGLEGAAWLQTGLVVLQYVAMGLLAAAAFWAVYRGAGSEGSIQPSLEWLNPFGIDSFSDFIKGVLLCIFIYWGWDAILAINEETKDPEKTPGRAAIIATVILLGGYVLLTMATVSYAGLGDTGIGLNAPDSQGDVLPTIALPLIGTWGTEFIIIVILLSTVASAQTTILPTARGTLAMATYKALPAKFARVHPKYMTPGYSTFMTCAVGLVLYVLLTILSGNILEDTVSSISLAIAFYYSLTAFSCVWYFRHEAFTSFRKFMFVFLLPLIGGIFLAIAFVISAYQMLAPDYGSTAFFGIGSVFVIGVGSLLVGVVLMFLWQLRQPEFFRGETLKHDTPALVPE